jgi:hypothetical protein
MGMFNIEKKYDFFDPLANKRELCMACFGKIANSKNIKETRQAFQKFAGVSILQGIDEK